MQALRRRAILEIIANTPVGTQTELAAELQKRGLTATQATVSRDIKELGLVKVQHGEASYRYALPAAQERDGSFERLRRLFRDAVVRMDVSENLIVIRTLPGTAHAVGACLDRLEWPAIIGTVAGDDTVLVVVKPKEAAANLLTRFQAMLV